MAYEGGDIVLVGVGLVLFWTLLAVLGLVIEWPESKEEIAIVLSWIFWLIVCIPTLTVQHISQWRKRRAKKREYIPWKPCSVKKIEYGDELQSQQDEPERRKSA